MCQGVLLSLAAVIVGVFIKELLSLVLLVGAVRGEVVARAPAFLVAKCKQPPSPQPGLGKYPWPWHSTCTQRTTFGSTVFLAKVTKITCALPSQTLLGHLLRWVYRHLGFVSFEVGIFT